MKLYGYTKVFPQDSIAQKLAGIANEHRGLEKKKIARENKKVEQDICALFIELHSLRDWAREEINNDSINKLFEKNYILSLVSDVANTIKHRKLKFVHNKEFYKTFNYPFPPKLSIQFVKSYKVRPCLESYYVVEEDAGIILIAHVFDTAIRIWKDFLLKNSTRSRRIDKDLK